MQFFVGEVQRLMTIADSILLMDTARAMRAELLREKWAQKCLRKLEGNAGHQWFKRWRDTYGIAKRVTGMKLKVSRGKK